MDLAAARDQIVRLGAALYDRRITPGRTGNLSVRCDDLVVMTPTGACLGRLEPEGLSLVALDGSRVGGPQPTKEAGLHVAMYARSPGIGAVAHSHSTHAVAVSILTETDPDQAIAALTAYFAMRVGRLPLIPYFAPGDAALAGAVAQLPVDVGCALLAHHGPIASGADLESAVDALEEIEETARLSLLTHGRTLRTLPPADFRRPY